MSNTDEKQWWTQYVPQAYRPRSRNKSISQEETERLNTTWETAMLSKSLDELKESDLYNKDYLILAHKDCTEQDLVDLAKTKARLDWKLADDGRVVGEFDMWGQIFMDPHSSDELKEAIVEGSKKDLSFNLCIGKRLKDYGFPNVIDYYLKREDCPKEFFVPAVQLTMDSYYHKYTRQTDYEVDAEYLKKIVAHPNMTEEAFDEALDIVAERMCFPADDVNPYNPPYHYQGEDDTCDLSKENKEEIMQTMLKNKACTPEVAIEVFAAAKEAGLLNEIRDFAQKENLFPNAEKDMESRQAEQARQEEIKTALDRVHKKSEDFLETKKAGDVELNKLVMKEKFGDPLAKNARRKINSSVSGIIKNNLSCKRGCFLFTY